MAKEPTSRDVIRAITRMASLPLSDQQFDDLVAAYRIYEPILERLPRDLPYSAEPSHIFDPRGFMPEGGSRE